MLGQRTPDGGTVTDYREGVEVRVQYPDGRHMWRTLADAFPPIAPVATDVPDAMPEAAPAPPKRPVPVTLTPRRRK